MTDKKDTTQQKEAGRIGGQNRKEHGIYAFERRGSAALDDDQQSVYIELRDQFKSEPGRLEYREHLAGHIAMMLELGFSNIGQLAEKGQPIWESPPVARMGTYLNALIRLIDGWPKDAKDNKNILDLMQGDD